MSEQEKCPVEVWDGWRGRVCGRPVKRDDMCGLHAAAKDRRERNAADRKAKYAEQRRLAQERVERQAALVEAAAAVERVTAIVERWEREADERGPDDMLYTHGVAAILRHAITPTPPTQTDASEAAVASEEGSR